MQSGQTGQWTKAETGKTLSFHVPASAPIIVPAEKQRVKAGRPQRQKLGFTVYISRKGNWRENAFLGAPLSARSLAFGHRGALPPPPVPWPRPRRPPPSGSPEALRQQRGPGGGVAARRASSILSLGNRDVRKQCLPSTAYANRAIIPRKVSGNVFRRLSMKDKGSASSGGGISVSGAKWEILSHFRA